MLSFPKLTATAALALLLGGLTVGAGAWLGPDAKKADDAKPNRVADGPPLPGGANARLGEAKFNHGAAIARVLVAQDGKTILTQGERSVRIWDAQSGQDLGGVDVPDDGPDFWTSSLTPDGRTLLTTRRNGTAQVWNLADRKLVRSFPLAAPPFDLAGRCEAVHALDGSAIAVVTADGSLRVCDVATGRERDDLRSHSDGLTAAAFTADSKTLVLAGKSAALRFLDVATGQSARSEQFFPQAQSIALSQNGDQVVGTFAAPAAAKGESQTVKHTLTLFAYQKNPNGYSARALGDGHDPMIFTPDGRYLLARNSPGEYLGQWDLATGRNMRQYPFDTFPVNALAFTHDGRTLITADQRLQFWDWKTGQRVDKQEAVASTPIPERSFVLTADGQAAVIAESEGRLVVRELATNRVLRRFEPTGVPPGKSVALKALGLSANGEKVAAVGELLPGDGSGASVVWLWDFAAGKIQRRLSALPYNLLEFSRDSQTLAASSLDHKYRPRFWDTATGQERSLLPNLQQPLVVAFAPDGKKLLFFEHDNQRWTLISLDGKSPSSWVPPLPGQLVRWACSTDLKTLAFAWVENSANAGITIFQDHIRSQSPLQFQGMKQFPTQLALSADGRRLAGSSYGETPEITVWDVATGRELKRYTGLRGQAAGVAFTPDGRRLVAASTDGTLLVWEVGD